MTRAQVWRGLDEIPHDLGPTVVTIGNFDGVHRGHQAVLARVADEAGWRGASPVAITFDPHPLAVLFPERAPRTIASLEQRLAVLSLLPLSAVLVITFTTTFAELEPEDFVHRYLVDALHASAVVVGADTRFGHRNAGDVGTLRDLGSRLGFDVVVIDDFGELDRPVSDGPHPPRWSSSMVRRHLAEGDAGSAAHVLGRAHQVTGVVVHGNHRGRDLGFPTANLGADSEGLVPLEGVYAGWLVREDLAEHARDRRLPCAISIGTNPTFTTRDRRTVEAYVLDRTDLDLYDQRVTVEFVERLRPTLKFDGIEALVEQMREDVTRCREILGTD